jgi:hypothetical protein
VRACDSEQTAVPEWCEHDDYPSGSIKRGKFPDYLKNNSLSSRTLH